MALKMILDWYLYIQKYIHLQKYGIYFPSFRKELLAPRRDVET